MSESGRKTFAKKREIPLSLFFLKYFIYIFVGIVLILAAVVGAFSFLWTSGVVYPASYAQEQAGLAVEAIQSAEEVTQELIPELCRYVVLDETGQVRSGNMQETEAARAWQAVEGKLSGTGGYIGAYYYKVIPRKTEYCVLQYQIISQYRSAALRKCLPPPEILLALLTLAMILLLVGATAARFSYVLRAKLAPLTAVSDKIRQQELEFDIARGSLKEINAILQAMDDMRIALKESLENQWRLEQMKNDQMCALAHDLKTPLTLVRGNADLLSDTALTAPQRECVDCIADNALQMQAYVQTMLEITRASASIPIRKSRTDLGQLLGEIKKQAGGLCAIRDVGLRWDCDITTKEICADAALLTRALMNIFVNAVEHTPSGGTVRFEGSEDGTELLLVISDTGEGFTETALRHAKEQFYMDDDSRTSGSAHYGMGLYIADAAIRQHHGSMLLENPPRTHGASVRIRIPLGHV